MSAKKKYPKKHRLYTEYRRYIKHASKLKKRKSSTTRKASFQTINAPFALSLFDKRDHHKTAEFLDRLKKRSIAERVQINFAKCHFITAHAALLLYSVIEEARESESQFPIRFLRSGMSPEIEKMLRSTGVWQLASSEQYVSTSSFPIVSANCSKGDNERWEDVLDHIGSNIFSSGLEPEEERRFGAAISEAANNVLDHAYPEYESKSEYQKMRWWMVCEVVKDQLFLAILDRGVGIPVTLPEKSWFRETIKDMPNLLQELLSRDSDAKWIELSLTKGETSTQRKERGLGGPTILDLVERNDVGKLWVFSNRGIYCRRNGKIHYSGNSDSSINGTIIQWNIRLKDEHRD